MIRPSLTAPYRPFVAVMAAIATACSPADNGSSDTDPPVDPTLDPDRPAARGQGGPAVTFTADDLGGLCAHLPGNLDRDVDEIVDVDHKNLVGTYRGHLVVPWAPEYGRGGLTFWDVSDPCSPTFVGEGRSPFMRETHNITFQYLPPGDPHAGDWAAVNMGGAVAYRDLQGHGLQFWDVSDPTAPVAVSEIVLEDLFYPDAYERINLSLSWAYPYVYVAGAIHGLYIVDATDPTAPALVAHLDIPDMRIGGVFALGEVLWLTGSEQRTHALYDIRNPVDPQPILGGRFASVGGHGTDSEAPVEAYHTNVAGNLALFARKEGGGGPIVYDITDPSNPTFVGEMLYEDMGGAYVFYDEGLLFTGDSHAGHITDFRDPSNPTLVRKISFVEGEDTRDADFDTLTPYGNVAIAAVDDPGGYIDLAKGEAMAVVPWTEAPDTTAPTLLASRPADGAADVATTQALYLGFDEFVEPSLALDGIGTRLRDADGAVVPCWSTAEESRVHVRPKAPLDPGTTYTLEILEGGLTDLNGNAVPAAQTLTFTTAP